MSKRLCAKKALSHSRCYELYELSAGPQGLAPVLAVNAKVNAKGLHFCCVLLRMQILVGSSVTEPAYPLPELFATPSSLLRPCCVLLRIQILVVLGHSLYSLYSQPRSLPNLPKFQLPEAVSEVYASAPPTGVKERGLSDGTRLDFFCVCRSWLTRPRPVLAVNAKGLHFCCVFSFCVFRSWYSDPG